MKLKNKIILTLMIEFAVLLIAPLISVRASSPHETMGLMIIFFFAINPIASAVVSAFAGKEIKKLWWLPLSFAILFLLSYWIVLNDIVADLIIYAIAYTLIGFIAMTVSYLIKRK